MTKESAARHFLRAQGYVEHFIRHELVAFSIIAGLFILAVTLPAIGGYFLSQV